MIALNLVLPHESSISQDGNKHFSWRVRKSGRVSQRPKRWFYFSIALSPWSPVVSITHMFYRYELWLLLFFICVYFHPCHWGVEPLWSCADIWMRWWSGQRSTPEPLWYGYISMGEAVEIQFREKVDTLWRSKSGESDLETIARISSCRTSPSYGQSESRTILWATPQMQNGIGSTY